MIDILPRFVTYFLIFDQTSYFISYTPKNFQNLVGKWSFFFQ